MLKISQSVEKAVSEAEDYFGTLSNGNTVSCMDIITLADKEEVKKIAEKNDCDVKIGEFSVVFFDKGEVAENFKEMVGQSKKAIKSSGAFVDKDEDGSPECIIEIKEDGKWKAVGIDKNSPDGWSTDVKFKVFPSVDEAKRSGMAKRIKNAGYSEPDTLRFSSK